MPRVDRLGLDVELRLLRNAAELAAFYKYSPLHNIKSHLQADILRCRTKLSTKDQMLPRCLWKYTSIPKVAISGSSNGHSNKMHRIEGKQLTIAREFFKISPFQFERPAYFTAPEVTY